MELGNLFGHDVGYGLNDGKMDVPTTQAAQFFDLRTGQVKIMTGTPDMAKQQFSCTGQPDASRQPLEQVHAERFLEIEDMPVYGR
ncbi:MAG: hypothetical protein VW600_04970 [Ferrovibrio sp.]